MLISKPTSHLSQREDHPLFLKHTFLRGVGIGINEASRKYDIPQPTISRWVKRGWIDLLGKDVTYPQNRRLLIDECQMAYCAEVYHIKQAEERSQGRRLFNDDGTPFVPISPPRSKLTSRKIKLTKRQKAKR